MKGAWVVLILILLGALTNWMRAGESFPIVRVLPLVGGCAPDPVYDLAGGAMIVTAIAFSVADAQAR
jgi:hypothetical protein